jgi:murein L,D-transpeptidase YafK
MGLMMTTVVLLGGLMAYGPTRKLVIPPLPPAERVEAARKRTEDGLRARCAALKVAYPPKAIFFRAYKEEREVEIWVGNQARGKLQKFGTYAVAGASGTVGPKRKEGDRQVPEGCYDIVLFNPASRFHLSLRVGYPNEADRVWADADRPGGDIMIHGDTRSIGCLAMTDEKIEEIYTLAFAVTRGKQFPVFIFPARLSPKNLSSLKSEWPDRKAWHELWDDLATIDGAFNATQTIPKVDVVKGRYRLKP